MVGMLIKVQHESHELSGDEMRKRQAYCQLIFKQFTKRCVKEYVLALQETHSYSSHKNRRAACSLKVGDLIIIKEDIIPRLSWKRGVVDQLVTGQVYSRLFVQNQKPQKKPHLLNDFYS